MHNTHVLAISVRHTLVISDCEIYSIKNSKSIMHLVLLNEIIIIIIIIKDLQIHRPQLASTNRSYLQVNYIFLVLPSEIEPSLEDSNRRGNVHFFSV